MFRNRDRMLRIFVIVIVLSMLAAVLSAVIPFIT